MGADVVGECGTSVERQAGGGVEADKVGSDRLAFAIETARTERNLGDRAESVSASRIRVYARARSASSQAQSLSAIAARPMEDVMSRRLAGFVSRSG